MADNASKRHVVSQDTDRLGEEAVSPVPPVKGFSRPHLIERMRASFDGMFTFIVAPAGFGKSNLLAEYHESLVKEGIATAWVNLDAHKPTLRGFLVDLAIALIPLDRTGSIPHSLAQNGFPGLGVEPLKEIILHARSFVSSRFALFLDDYHLMNTPELAQFISQFVERRPETMHVVIGSRDQPLIASAHHYASGLMSEFTIDDLRFSREETDKLLGGKLNHLEKQDFYKQTEGWPSITFLADAALVEQSAYKFDIDSLTSSDGPIGRFFTEQIFDQLPDDLRDFVLNISVLHRVNAPLAAAITGHESSAAMLQRLQRLEPLMTPLDEDRVWYRFHTLFSKAARNLLKAENPILFEQVHFAAAKWCASQGFFEDAAHYAQHISDFGLYAQVIEAAGGWRMSYGFGGQKFLSLLLQNFPDEKARDYPRVLYAKAYMAMRSSRLIEAARYCEQARAKIDPASADPEVRRDRLAVESMVLGRKGAFLDIDSTTLETNLSQVMPGDSITRVAIILGLAYRDIWTGAFDAAHQRVSDFKDESVATNRQGLIVNASYCLGVLAYCRGEIRQAKTLFEAATALAPKQYGEVNSVPIISSAYMRMLDYWAGHDVESTIERLTTAIYEAFGTDGSFRSRVPAFDALIDYAFEHNDLDRVDELLSRLESEAEILGIRRLDQVCEALRLQHTSLIGDHDTAGRLHENITTWFSKEGTNQSRQPWFVLFAAGRALSTYFVSKNDYKEAMRYANIALGITGRVGANLMHIRMLVWKTALLEQTGKPEDSLNLLQVAVSLGQKNGIYQPFRSPKIRPLLLRLRAVSFGDAAEKKSRAFLDHLLPESEDEEAQMTDKEILVMHELLKSRSNKEIAKYLNLSQNTVKFHLKNIFIKLNAKDRSEAVLIFNKNNK